MSNRTRIIQMWISTLAIVLLIAGTASAFGSKANVLVYAGSKARDNCPITVSIPQDSPLCAIAKSGQSLRAISAQETAPATVLSGKDGCELAFVVNGMKAWETRTYQIVPGTAYAGNAVNFNTVTSTEEQSKIEITIGGKPFTTYDSRTEEMKKMWPNFYPLFGPNGARMTRNYPMETVEGESHDHPHHQSLWVSHGDINDVDFWGLSENHGYSKQKNLNVAVGPAAGRLYVQLDWTDHQGKKVMEENRVVTFWGTPDCARMIDFDIAFKATEGDVKFGDTKEGGLVALRVAETMNEKQKENRKGGTITNAAGGVGMADCWGKPAAWCDYSGPVGDSIAGLTIMDSPTELFYPIRFHVRDYGLFAANPFGLSQFVDKSQDGSRVLKQGESWHLQFRVYIHAGDVKDGRVAEAYENFADAPMVKLQ